MSHFSESVKRPLRYVYGLVPANIRLGQQYWRLRKFLERAQWWSAEEISGWQLDRLRKIIDYAYTWVPGYRQLYSEAGVKPEDLQTLADIRFFPTSSKTLLDENKQEFVSRKLTRWQLRYVTTSGTTGTPFGFYHTRVNTWMENAFMHTGWAWVGWHPGGLSAVLRGYTGGNEGKIWAYNPLRREISLSSKDLSESTYPRYFEILKRHRWMSLQAFPSMAAYFSDLMIDHGDEGGLDIPILFVGSENFYSWQKGSIYRAFPKARIFSWYGHTEQAVLAPWCEKAETYHAWPFYGLTEVIDDEGHDAAPGESGELVGTSFWNYGTPFIRYRTTDRARKGRLGCKDCGRQFLILDEIEGRQQNMFVTPSGGYITSTIINTIHSDVFDDVRQFQFYQDLPGKVIVKIVPKEGYTAASAGRIAAAVKEKLGEDVVVDVDKVDEIPKTKGGKYLLLDQKLPTL